MSEVEITLTVPALSVPAHAMNALPRCESYAKAGPVFVVSERGFFDDSFQPYDALAVPTKTEVSDVMIMKRAKVLLRDGRALVRVLPLSIPLNTDCNFRQLPAVQDRGLTSPETVRLN